MKRKNPRGPVYGAVGAAAAVAVCLGAMVLAPAAAMPGTAGHPAAVQLAAARGADQPSDTQPTDPGTTTPATTDPGQGNNQQGNRPGDHPGDRPTATPDQPALQFASPVARLKSLTANPDCTLKVPANPLSARGLMTPYVLNSAGMACAENNEGTAAFVQATILDPATGALSVYDPVVTDAGQQVTAPPVTLPRNAVVTIWTGFNGNVLKLAGPGARNFVNFAQQSYDSSPRFFAWLRFDVARHLVTVPALGADANANGAACPTVRDFSVVDQDQSDNVPVTYGAPFNVSNGSDDDLLTLIDAAIGCTPGLWQVPLQDPGVTQSGAGMTTAGPLEEVQAQVTTPQALVPGLDPFVTLNAKPDLFLQNLYRSQVGQPPTGNGQDTKAYCQNLAAVGVPRLQADAATEAGFPAPAFAMIGTNLANVLAARFAATWANLTCPALTGMTSPITVTLDAGGMAVSAAYGVSMPVTATPPTTPATIVPATTTPPTTAPSTMAPATIPPTATPATTDPVTTAPPTPDPTATGP